MKVSIIEANHPDDFYDGRLDGAATKSLLDMMQIECCYKIALNLECFEKSLMEACAEASDVIHLACHGDEHGIQLSDGTDLSWEDLSHQFQDSKTMPNTLVMATCHGGVRGLASAFQEKENRPTIIFGSTKSLCFEDYCVAWSLLYTNIEFSKVTTSGKKIRRPSAKKALEKICASVDNSFVYRRFNSSRGSYVRFPKVKDRYSVVRKEAAP